MAGARDGFPHLALGGGGSPYALWLMAFFACAVPAAYAEGITVLNQQSYPEVGGLWTVRFVAQGTHDLVVSGAEGTTIGAGGAFDVSFVGLRGADGRSAIPTLDDGRLVFAGFEGGGAAALTVRVNTPGHHAMLLGFGGDEALALNSAYPSQVTEIASAGSAPSLARSDNFGSSAVMVGDLDRDGIADLAVGASGDDAGGLNAGAVHLLYLNSDGTVKRTVEINASTANGPQLASGDQFGRSLAAVGDLDRDGIADLAVGASGDDAVHLMFLNPDGTVKRTAEINSSTANGPQLASGDQFGRSLAAVGDLDRDGIADLAVGASGDDAGGANAGAVHLLFLNSDGTVKRTAEINSSTANGPQLAQADFLGSSLAAVGDIDRDGTADLAVGAYGDDEGDRAAGAVHLLFLNPDGTVKRTAEINSSTANGPQLAQADFLGWSAAAVGDLDRDGTPDLAVGAVGDDAGSLNAGAVHLMFLNPDGTAKRTVEINASTPSGPQLAGGDNFGWSVAALGDLDRDGIQDIAVGATGDDARATDAGTVHIVRLDAIAPSGDGTMRAVLKLSADSAVLPTMDSGDRFGTSAAVLGDLNSDGVPDLAVGADRDDSGGTDRGAVYVALMHADGSIDEITKIASGAGGGPALSDGDYFGSSVAAVGDLDGDGIPDIAVGAYGADTAVASPTAGATGADRGALYLVLLNADGTAKSTSVINDRTARGPDLDDSDWFGYSVAGIGDMDGDGTDDLAAGAPNDGAVYVLFMNSDRTIKSTARVISLLSTASDYFGSSVASVGDVDGDGTGDLAVGAVRDAVRAPGSPRAQAHGAVHVLSMNSDGTVKIYSKIDAQTPGLSLSAGSEFGSSLAAVGDLDGDGVPDLAAGAESNDGPANNSGTLHLLLLDSGGTLKSSSDIGRAAGGIPSPGAGHEFGSSVASMGDLDGDGSADLVVGAKSAGIGGDAYVLFMDGLSAGSAVRLSESGPDAPLSAGDMFGSVAGIGDLNRDGVPDLAVGAAGDDTGTRDTGAVYLFFFNADGTSESRAVNAGTSRGPALGRDDRFGSSVAEIGDLDRDGVADLAVGAGGDLNETGTVHLLFLNSDGTVKRTAEINGSVVNGPSLRVGDRFGSSVAGIGDLDRDGVPDLAAGAPRDGGLGSAHLIFLNSDGTVKRSAKLDFAAVNMPSVSFGDMFGSSVAGIGDLDRDGVQDLAVGSSGSDAGGANRGAVHLLFLKPDGTLKPGAVRLSSLTSNGPALANGDGFGSSVARAGDIDRDGTEDLLAGADGSAYLMLLNPDGYVKETREASRTTVPGLAYAPATGFGRSVAILGDLDGDGSTEFAVGGPGYDDSRGAAYVLSAFRPPFVAGVGSPTPDGAYGQGSRIEVQVEFSEPVSVTGSPALLLEAGATDRLATYVSGSGTDTLNFRYTVQYGDLSPDLGYVGRSSLTLRGGSIEASSDTAVLGLPRPGAPGSLSFSKALQIDGIRPTLEATPRLNLASGVLDLDFDEPIDASEIDPGGVTVLDLSSSTQLGGAAVPAQDTDMPALRLTGEQTRSLVLAYLRDGPLRITVSGSAFEDLVGNAFAGTAGAQLQVELALGRDAPAFSDSARAYKSGFVPSSSPALSSSERSHKSAFVPSSSPVLSGSERSHKSAFVPSSSPVLSGSERSHKSGFAEADLAAPSDSALSLNALVRASGENTAFSDSALSLNALVRASSDAAIFSDPARAYQSGFVEPDIPAFSDLAAHASALVRASSDTAAFSDLAVGLNALVSASSDTAVFTDSARSYKSSFAPASSPAISSSVEDASALVSAPSETAVFTDSARSFKSALASSSSPVFTDSARSYRSAYVSSDTAVFTDSAAGANMVLSSLTDTAVFTDSARSYTSAFVSSDTAVFTDSATGSGMVISSLTDTTAFSDIARSYKSAFVSSDTAVFSDSASGANMVLSSLSDAAVFTDSARSYTSAFVSSDTAVFTDSATGSGMVLSSLSETAVFTDSARSFKSAFVSSDTAVFSDSATGANMVISSLTDTAVFTDSVRSYRSAFVSSDTAVFTDSATGSGMVLSSLSETAVFTDSARSFKSAFVSSDTAVFTDSAAGANMVLSSLSDTAVLSDLARAYQSASVSSSSPVLSDAASVSGMRLAGLSDSVTVSDLARSFKSGLAQSSSPVVSDSAGRAGMRVAASADTAVFSDLARSFKSAAFASDSLSPSSSASYAGMFMQGVSDSAQFSDSARALRSGILSSSSPTLSDAASGSAAVLRIGSDTAVLADSARAYKSAMPASSAPAQSESVRWQSARAAFDSDSPVLADSAAARLSSAAKSDSPALSDSARAGASAKLLYDSPALRDGAATGLPRPPVSAADLPSVSDGARHAASGPAPDGAAPRISGVPARGTGSVGVELAVIHSVSYERCSEEPYAAVTVSPSGQVAVTVEQAGTITAARQSDRGGGAPDSSVWTAPIMQDAASLQIRAVLHRGAPATGDSQSLETDSCSGFVKYTAFGGPVAAGPAADPAPEEPPAEPSARLELPAEAASEAAEPEPGGTETAQAQTTENKTEPAVTPAESEIRPAPIAEPERPPAPGAETFRDYSDLTREPAAQAPERAMPAVWYAAAAAVVAAVAVLAVLARRYRLPPKA